MISIADGYARSLFDAAVRLRCVEEAAGDLAAVGAFMSPCGVYLNNPRAGTAEKTALLRELLSGHITPLALEFTLLLLARNHLRYFPAAAERYEQISDFYLGRVRVRIRTPFPIEIDTLDRLRGRLTELALIPAECAENVSFQIVLDREIIGGFIADCNGFQIDASLRKSLRSHEKGPVFYDA